MAGHIGVSDVRGDASQAPVIKTSLAWLAVAGFLVFLFDPGIMSNDSLQSLKQARTLQLTDWHPPIMALLWRPLDALIAGPAGMLLAQCVLYAYATARFSAQAFGTGLSRRALAAITVVFALFPPAMAITGMIWKDVWMSGFLTLAASYLFTLANKEGRSRIRAVAMLLACCLLATAFRHNAVAATAGLLAGMLYYAWPARTIAIGLARACVGGVALAVALAALVSLFNSAVARPMHVTTPLLLHDIAGIIAYSGEPEAASRLALSSGAKLASDERTFKEKILHDYTPAAAGPLLYSSKNRDAAFSVNVYSDKHDAAGVRAAWKAMLQKYPGAYLHHRAKALACLLQLCSLDSWKDRSYFLNPKYALTGSTPGTWQHLMRTAFLSPSLARIYFPAFWLLVTVVGMVVGLMWIGTRHSILLFLGLSSVGLATSLFFTSPIESYRYVHWSVMLGWCMLLMTIAAQVRTRGMCRDATRPSRLEG